MNRILILSAAATLCLAAASVEAAQPRCKVMDPTGTPLNVRDTPGGAKVSELHNGGDVAIIDMAKDAKGKLWALVAGDVDSAPFGWVYREFLACY